MWENWQLIKMTQKLKANPLCTKFKTVIMNRNEARKIAETITNEQIKEMFDKAQSEIKDWAKVSSVNKGLTKGSAWNILTKAFNVDDKIHILAKTNMVREFGDFLPIELRIPKKIKKEMKPPCQQ